MRRHCADLDFCERDYLDVDLAGLRRERSEVAALLRHLGFEESVHVTQATKGRQLQFFRPCRHCDGETCIHDDDHIDLFLDHFKMDHELDLRDSLDGDDYTLTPADTLLTKLQVFDPGEKDLRDIVTLLKDVEVTEGGGPGTVDSAAVARRCAADWGLSHDVEQTLGRVIEMLDGYGLDGPSRERVRERVARLRRAIEAEPKTLAWRLRAKVGERRPWHNVVEEQGEDDL